MHIFAVILLFIPFLTFAQLSEKEVSEMCMNQIVAGMVQDKVLGDESGICIMFNQDPAGNITGMNFKMKSSAFELGKDILDGPSKERLKTVKEFVLNYQKIVTKNPNLTMDDVDLQVRSYADGVGGPRTYDDSIKSMKKWSDLLPYIGDDKASLGYLGELAPQSKSNPDASVNWEKLSPKAQSLIRNVVLGKRRSMAICKEFGITNCDQRPNVGFASPDLEKRENKDTRECADRRVSVIKVNLDKAVQISNLARSEFHPRFEIPSGPEGNELKSDMQFASAFQIVKQHEETVLKYKDPKVREELKKEVLEKRKTIRNPQELILANKKLHALNSYGEDKFSVLDLPPEALKSEDLGPYDAMIRTFGNKYVVFKESMKREPELLALVKKGDFITFKEKFETLDKRRQNKIQTAMNALINFGSNPSTDFFNFYSASQALQYHYIKNPNSPNLTNASSVVNQSNSPLTIKLDTTDIFGPDHSKSSKKASWQCYGGCETGIHEGDNGEFLTKFRHPQMKAKSAMKMEEEFKNQPLGFGSLKNLSVYTIKNCANCDCMRNRNVSLDEVLKGPGVTKVSITKLEKQSDGTRAFKQTAGVIEDPYNTCIFTPPVAHTCKVKPQGKNQGHGASEVKPNYACAMWDKSQHGLRWTTNFLKEGLGLAETAGSVDCHNTVQPLKAVAATAMCQQSDPPSIPDSCK